jgi:hypothetical protein
LASQRSQTVSLRPLANLLSASTTDIPAQSAAAAPVRAQDTTSTRWHVPPGRFYLGLIVVALIVGALSLLIPSTPSYDPWAWIVWGREIVHLKLHTTGGPTWKPLPVLFTTLFAPFGQAEPDMWLVVARAGAFAAVVMVFRMSFRLTRQIGSYFTSASTGVSPLIGLAPALMAGLIAAIGLTLSGGYISDNALGYSEGLATAVILIAVERHLEGKPRQAFALGFFAALDRPEIWLFWGPYGLYLFWKDAGARKLVIGLFVLIPILWFLPEYWGSGHFLRGVNRAQHPRSNSLAFAHCPFCSELVDAAWPTILLRIKVAAAVLVGVVAFLVVRLWRGSGSGSESRWDRLRAPQTRAQTAAALAGVMGLAWFVVIAIMTQIGFSGNNRYLVIGSALVEVCGAVAFGWAGQEIGNLLAGLVRRGRSAASGGGGVTQPAWLAGVAVVGLGFALLPSWVGGNLIDVQRTHRALVYQAHLRQDVTKIVRESGGAAKLLRCGTVMTEGFQVPMVAWTLGVHTVDIEAPPAAGAPPGPAPNVILQTRAQHNATLLPIVHSWPNVHYTEVAHVRTFNLFTACRG